MSKQWLDHTDSCSDDMTTLPPDPPMTGQSDSSSIIFCIDPDDPLMERIVAGQVVTYNLVRGDSGQWYATDIRLASDDLFQVRAGRA